MARRYVRRPSWKSRPEPVRPPCIENKLIFAKEPPPVWMGPVIRMLQEIRVPKDVKPCRNILEAKLRVLRWKRYMDVAWVELPWGARSQVHLLLTDGERLLAVQVDNRAIRKRTVWKFVHLPEGVYRIVILRTDTPPEDLPPGVDLLVCIPPGLEADTFCPT